MEKLLRVKVHPGSREDRIEGKTPTAYEAWVRAKPEQGKANAAVLALLAGKLGIATKRLRIMKGATSPSKIIAVLG